MKLQQYTARVLDTATPPGTRPGFAFLTVGIFRREGGVDEQVGTYTRNYHALFETFYPFRKAGREFALYAPHYAATRIMALPSCRDLGGEEPAGGGFCPVEYYVPAYLRRDVKLNPRQELHYNHHVKDLQAVTELQQELELVDERSLLDALQYYPFGFVAGCVWSDDRSWKVQYLDLAEAEHGVIRRDDRFGYVELLDGMTLSQAIDIADETLMAQALRLAITGKHWCTPDGRPMS